MSVLQLFIDNFRHEYAENGRLFTGFTELNVHKDSIQLPMPFATFAKFSAHSDTRSLQHGIEQNIRVPHHFRGRKISGANKTAPGDEIRIHFPPRRYLIDSVCGAQT